MAEFQEVIKQWGRMCEKHICDNRDESEQILPLCPLVTKHSGYPCDDAVTYLSQESVAQVEEIVMSWAAEHPEPKYPTWAEWLESVHVLTNNKTVTYKDGNVTYGTKYYQSVSPNAEFYQPIPADIAQKLGLQPKEG